ncbi:ulp1 protease family, C-terminal catalytic domain-containing protein [Tanacetum coccineum]
MKTGKDQVPSIEREKQTVIGFEDKEACEQAYFKMDNALIDDRRIHVDFSQECFKDMEPVQDSVVVQNYSGYASGVEVSTKDTREYANSVKWSFPGTVVSKIGERRFTKIEISSLSAETPTKEDTSSVYVTLIEKSLDTLSRLSLDPARSIPREPNSPDTNHAPPSAIPRSSFFRILNISVTDNNQKLEHSMIEKRIMIGTSKGCLGNLEHHEDFDLMKTRMFYKKIIEKFTKISEERSELIETFREGITKFGEDQGIFDFYDQYKKLFKDAEFNLYDYSMDEYSESDADNNNNKNDDEEEKEKRNALLLTGDDREVAFSMEVDETKNEKEKQTENVKDQQAEKEKEKQAENEEKQYDIGKGTEEALSETKNDREEVHD